MRVIDERGLVWDESPYLAHHGIMGMHCGIRRYQPYPSGYRGNGEYIGKRNKIKNALKENKQAYKEAKSNYKEAKRDYSQLREYVQASDKNIKFMKKDLKSERKLKRDAKKDYKYAKKFGSLQDVREAKQNLKNQKLRKMKAINELQMAELLNRTKKKELSQAAAEFDKASIELTAQRAMYKASKKETKSELNRIKKQFEAEQKQHALDYDKKFAGDDTSTKLPQKDKNSRAAEQKELLDKANAADKARRDFIESKVKKYNPKTSEERDIAVAKVEKANAQKLKKLYDSSIEAAKRYDASRLKQRDFNKARSLRKRGLTYVEIARRLGVPPTTVWGILNY